VRKKVYIRKKDNIDGSRYLAEKLRKLASSTREITSGAVDADWQRAGGTDKPSEKRGQDDPIDWENPLAVKTTAASQRKTA